MKIERTWSSICLCCAVAQTIVVNRDLRALSLLITGASLIASGLVPSTASTFFFIKPYKPLILFSITAAK